MIGNKLILSLGGKMNTLTTLLSDWRSLVLLGAVGLGVVFFASHNSDDETTAETETASTVTTGDENTTETSDNQTDVTNTETTTENTSE